MQHDVCIIPTDGGFMHCMGPSRIRMGPYDMDLYETRLDLVQG